MKAFYTQGSRAGLGGKPHPRLERATTCRREETIRDLQRLLIESASQFVVVLDRPDGKILGLVTLHDLLRAEVEKGKGDDD